MCNLCQICVPTILYQWPPDEKTKWDARLKGGALSQTEYNDLYRVRQGKHPGGNWVSYSEVLSQAFTPRCPKCGNQNRTQFYDGAQPPIEEPVKK